MSRKISICILVLLVIVLLFGIWFGRKQNEKIEREETQVETEKMVVASTHEPAQYAYIVRAQDQMLVVYHADGKTVYMQTGIRMSGLDQSMQERARRGIGFATQKSLFDFLESYAS